MSFPPCYITAPERPWWTFLPGMNWRTVKTLGDADTALVNRVCALSCTVRLMTRQNGDQNRGRAADQGHELREWLDKAPGNEEAYLRRLALCQLTDIAPDSTTPRALRDLASKLMTP